MADFGGGEDYVIWSNEHRRWWAPGARGYRQRYREAGRFPRLAALSVCSESLPDAAHVGMISEIPVRCADIEAILKDKLVPEAF